MSLESKRVIFLIISLLTLLTFLILFVFRAADDNRLTSWQWVFDGVNNVKIYLCLIAGIFLAYLNSKVSFESPVLLFILSLIVAMVFWQTPEVIVDASRYFTQAKHLEMYGVGYFLKEWGRDIIPWTDMPLLPFLYGMIFKFLGESRLYIQVFTTLLFSTTVVLTYRVGKELWDKETGFYAGMLLLGIPYIFTQVPLMLVDIPAMFFLMLSIFSFIRAMDNGGAGCIILSSFAIFLTFFTKYSTWLMLTVLGIIFLTYLAASRGQRNAPDSELRTPNYVYRASLVALISGILIASVILYKFDVFSEQIGLLFTFQMPGLRRWGESSMSTFFFQTHPFITLAALYSVYAALKERDIKYAIIAWLVILVVLLQIRRIRYIIMIFPMVALMASYGLRLIRDKEIKRFIVSCAVISSLVTAIFAYLPFVKKISVINIKNAGGFLDSIDEKKVEVFVMPYNELDINPAVSVPILDFFTGKKIIYHYDIDPAPHADDIQESPLRFTWEYRNPEYYTDDTADSGNAVLVIRGEAEQTLPPHIAQKIKSYKNFREFNTSEGIFHYRTIVRVYYN